MTKIEKAVTWALAIANGKKTNLITQPMQIPSRRLQPKQQ